jgi:hypothetical protein
MENRRRQERHRTLKSGKIIFNGNASIVDCTVRNVSEGGACVLVQSVVGIPESFDLLMDDIKRSCKVKRRSANRMSVSFQ